MLQMLKQCKHVIVGVSQSGTGTYFEASAKPR